MLQSAGRLRRPLESFLLLHQGERGESRFWSISAVSKMSTSAEEKAPSDDADTMTACPWFTPGLRSVVL